MSGVLNGTAPLRAKLEAQPTPAGTCRRFGAVPSDNSAWHHWCSVRKEKDVSLRDFLLEKSSCIKEVILIIASRSMT